MDCTPCTLLYSWRILIARGVREVGSFVPVEAECEAMESVSLDNGPTVVREVFRSHNQPTYRQPLNKFKTAGHTTHKVTTRRCADTNTKHLPSISVRQETIPPFTWQKAIVNCETCFIINSLLLVVFTNYSHLSAVALKYPPLDCYNTTSIFLKVG